MKRSIYHVYGRAIVVIMLGSSLQWLLLSGSSPFDIFTAFNKVSGAAPSVALESQIHLQRPNFQTGVVFPRWGATAYSAEDRNWPIGLKEIQEQTSAQWLELTINLYQTSPTSTRVLRTPATPTPEALAAGIRVARAMHYHVFIVPLITVGGKVPWAGGIHFPTEQQTQAWFISYWQVYRPYVVVAAQTGAEELAIGTEFELLQQAPAFIWKQLIEQIHAVFSGMLTYDMNWSYLKQALPSWMRNPYLTTIGVSAYYPLTVKRERLDPRVLPTLWRDKVRIYLDALALQLGKPILISEIGYRDSADALYSPWWRSMNAPLDPKEQAAAYDAALQNVVVDPHIIGIFVWGWSVPVFEPNWRPAAQVIKRWYTALQV